MRTVVLGLAFFAMNLPAMAAPPEPKPSGPTAAQLAAAKEAYARFGTKHDPDAYPRTYPTFTLPHKTTDANL